MTYNENRLKAYWVYNLYMIFWKVGRNILESFGVIGHFKKRLKSFHLVDRVYSLHARSREYTEQTEYN